MTQKACFLLRIAPEFRNEYIERHRNLIPEMTAALRATGYRNYSIFMDPPTGLLVGYFESDDVEATANSMREHPATEQWNQHMTWMFVPVDTERGADHLPLLHVFDLDEQAEPFATDRLA